jgi:hypothetical protein
VNPMIRMTRAVTLTTLSADRTSAGLSASAVRGSAQKRGHIHGVGRGACLNGVAEGVSPDLDCESLGERRPWGWSTRGGTLAEVQAASGGKHLVFWMTLVWK